MQDIGEDVGEEDGVDETGVAEGAELGVDVADAVGDVVGFLVTVGFRQTNTMFQTQKEKVYKCNSSIFTVRTCVGWVTTFLGPTDMSWSHINFPTVIIFFCFFTT